MFFRKKKKEQQQVTVKNREKFGSSELHVAEQLTGEPSAVSNQESEEQSAISNQQSGGQSEVRSQKSGEEQTVDSLQSTEEKSAVSNQQSGKVATVNRRQSTVSNEQIVNNQQSTEEKDYEEIHEDKAEIVQSKSGTVKVKRNWDAYSLPDYLRNDDTQIQMEIKQSPKEQYFKIKRRLGRLDTLLEILPYWKNWITMFSLVFGIFTVIMLSVLIIGNFNSLKSEIPLFYNQQKLGSDQVNKSVFLFVPVAAFFFNLVIIRLSMMVYNFDRKLVLTINVALNLINLLLIIAVTQVLSLILN